MDSDEFFRLLSNQPNESLFLRAECAYWRGRAQQAEKALDHIREYAQRSTGSDTPPEPPVGTRFRDPATNVVVWFRGDLGWYCPRKDCASCPAQWDEVWDRTGEIRSGVFTREWPR